MAKKTREKKVETLQHQEASRKNIPSAEHQSVLRSDDAAPRPVKYPRNTDLDPQLVWRGKDEQDRGATKFPSSSIRFPPFNNLLSAI